jgi:hypothetical protein
MAIILPQVVYPKFLDTDYTLYRVTNTAETILSQNFEAWAKNIFIVPVPSWQQEIWADNGFVTINGELIYYDAVTKDNNSGKVTVLRNCIRNVDGKKPKFAAAGNFVRGFVVAQHHNQLARTIANIENFLGTRNTTDKNSISWKLNYLNSQNYAGDDALCPQIIFTYTILPPEKDATCVTIAYNATIQGNYTNFAIYFGDGTSTNLSLSGTHTYTMNETIDPYIEVTGFTCDCIITNPIRKYGLEPEFSPQLVDNGGAGGGSLNTNVGNTVATQSTTQIGQLGGPDPAGTGSGQEGDPLNPDNILQGGFGGGDGGAGGGDPNLDGGGNSLTFQNDSGPTTVTPLVIPEIPSFPDFTLSVANTIDNQTQLPPFVFPTLDIGPFGPIDIPSQISLIQTAFIPSQISFLQTNKIPSIIDFFNIPAIPSFISIVSVDKIPEQIIIEPAVIDMLDSEYAVNCTKSINLNNTTDGTEKYETLTESNVCSTRLGQTETKGGPDSNEIQKIEVVVHDFYVRTPTALYPRYDSVKILIEDPPDKNGITRKCLVMGSGFNVYKKENVPQHKMDGPVTLVFDDKSKKNFYNFSTPLQSTKYKTASNGNAFKRNFGLANLTAPAPVGPYSSQLAVFADRKVGLGKWKAYVVVGKGPIVMPTPKPTATPLPTPVNPSPPRTPMPTRRPLPTPQPLIPNKVPDTILSIGKICVRVYYYNQQCPAGTQTPTPTAATPTPEPWPTFPPYPTFPNCIQICEPTCAACTPTPTATVTPTPTSTRTPTPTPSKSPTPTPSPTPSFTPFIGTCEFACFDGWYRYNGSPDDCPSCDELPELYKPCKDNDPDYIYIPCPHL